MKTTDSAAPTPSSKIDTLLDRYFEIVDDIESTVGVESTAAYVEETEIKSEIEEAERVRAEIERALETSSTPSLELAMSDSQEQNFPLKANAFTVLSPEVRVRIGLAEALKAQRAAEFLREDAVRDAQATTVRCLDDRGDVAVVRKPRRRTARGTSELDLPPVVADEPAVTRRAAPTSPIASTPRPMTAPIEDAAAGDDIDIAPDATADRRTISAIAGALAGVSLFALAVTVPEAAIVFGGLCLLGVLAFQHRG